MAAAEVAAAMKGTIRPETKTMNAVVMQMTHKNALGVRLVYR